MKKLNTKIRRKGVVKATCFDQRSLNFVQQAWNEIVLEAGLDKVKYYILGEKKWQTESNNVICNAGHEVLNQILAGTYAGAGAINYMCLGTGVAPVPAATDTTLAVEAYRNETASASVSGAELTMLALFTESEVEGTFTEFGNVIDGTATVDTGALFTHHAPDADWVKTLFDALLVEITYTSTSTEL